MTRPLVGGQVHSCRQVRSRRACPVLGADDHLPARSGGSIDLGRDAAALRRAADLWHPRSRSSVASPSARRRTPRCLVPLVLRDEMTVLLTQRTDHLNDHPGQISFPAAAPRRATPTPIGDRAARGARGDRPRGVRGRGARQPADLHHRHRLHRHAGGRPGPAGARSLRLDPFEVAEVFEVPLAWLMNPANHQRHAVEIRGRDARVPLDPVAGHRRQRQRRAAISSGARPRRCCATSTASSPPERGRVRAPTAEARRYDRPR